MDTNISIPLSILSVLIIIANGAVCLLVGIKRNLRTYTNGFVVSLAISDALVGITLFLHYALAVESSVTLNIFYTTALVGSVANLSAVTFDRHLACTRPFHNKDIIAKYFIRIITFCWLIAVTCAVLPICWMNADFAAIALKVYQFSILIFAIATPYTLIFLCYWQIFRQIRKAVKRDKKLARSVRRSFHKPMKNISSEAKVAKVFVVISVMFVISWLPIIWTTLVVAIDKPQLLPHILVVISPFTLAFGSIINPMLYSFMKPDFKIVCRRLLPWRSPSRFSSPDRNRSRINQDLSSTFSFKTPSRLQLHTNANANILKNKSTS